MLVFYLTHNSSDVSHQVWVFGVFTFVIWRFCAELWETLRGCSGDRWKGNVRIRIKQRRKQRAGREGGGDKKKKKKTGSEIRFSLVAALHFPYQQARGNRQIWFSPKRANRKQAECVCGGGDRKERGWGKKRRKGKEWVNGKKMGKRGKGGDLRGWDLKEWDESQQGMLNIYTTKLTNQYHYCLKSA